MLLSIAALFLSLSICYLLQRSMEFQISYLLQKRTVRIICAADYRACSKPLFSKTWHFLDIYSLLSFQVGSFMYLYHHEMIPSFLKTYYNLEVKSIIILLDVPSQTVFMPAEQILNNLMIILFQGPKLWNYLPDSIIRSNINMIFNIRNLDCKTVVLFSQNRFNVA